MRKHFVTSYTYDALALRACGVRTSTTANTYTLRYDVLRDCRTRMNPVHVHMYRKTLLRIEENVTWHWSNKNKHVHPIQTVLMRKNFVKNYTYPPVWSCLGIACLRDANFKNMEHVTLKIWRALWLRRVCVCMYMYSRALLRRRMLFVAEQWQIDPCKRPLHVLGLSRLHILRKLPEQHPWILFLALAHCSSSIRAAV